MHERHPLGSGQASPLEQGYKVLVPFRAFFEVGLSPSNTGGQSGAASLVRRLEASNVPVGSFVMPWNDGLWVQKPGEELARAMLRSPKPPRPYQTTQSVRARILLSRRAARLGLNEPARRKDWERLQDMAEAGFLREVPPPNPKTDLVGFDFLPPMERANRILPGGRGGVVEIEPSHELVTFKTDIEDLVQSLMNCGAEQVSFEDIGTDDLILMRADFSVGWVVVASRPETSITWMEGLLPNRDDLIGLAVQGEMSREDFLGEMRAAIGEPLSPGP